MKISTLSVDGTALRYGQGSEWNWQNFSVTLKPGTPRDLMRRFRFKYVIDWMEFCVTLQSPSQFRHVQARLASIWPKMYVTPVDGPASSNSFTFKLNDPPGPDQFLSELQAMALPGEPPITENDVVIRGVEIALDAYIPGSDRAMLAFAATYFLQHQAHPPSGPPRITYKGRLVVPTSIQEIFEALLSRGCSVNCGLMGSDHTIRGYVKDYDTVDGVPYARLPAVQCRARFENTLRGKALPFTTIAGWRSCRFEKVLADRFALVMPDPKSACAAAMERHVMQLGRRPDSPKRRPSDRNTRGQVTVRDSHFNDKGRQALRAMTKRQCCENSVSADLLSDHAPLGSAMAMMPSPRYCINNTGTAPQSTNQQTVQKEEQSPLTVPRLAEDSMSQPDHVDVTGHLTEHPVRLLNQGATFWGTAGAGSTGGL